MIDVINERPGMFALAILSIHSIMSVGAYEKRRI
jgi:hypothetical protein